MTTSADIRFSMYTPSGNDAVRAMCDRIIERIRSGELRRFELEKAIEAGVEKLSKTRRPKGDKTSWGEVMTGTYDEVYDTEPQYGIQDYISIECEAQGWKPVSRWEW